MDNEAKMAQELAKPSAGADGGGADGGEAGSTPKQGILSRVLHGPGKAALEEEHFLGPQKLASPKIFFGRGAEEKQRAAEADDIEVLLADVGRFFNPPVVGRLTRFLGISGAPIVLLVILYFQTDGGAGNQDNHLSRVIGVGIGLLFTIYFMQLGWLFRVGFTKDSNTYIFKVLTSADRVPQWTTMTVANNQLLYHYRPIQSISEFSAISGGAAGRMLANLGPLSWVAVAVLFAAEMQCLNGVSSTVDVSKVLIMVGVCGIVMIGLFELNQFNWSMKIFHYLGTGMAAQILIAGVIQASNLDTAWLVIQLLLSVLAVSALFTWLYLSTSKRALIIENECAGAETKDCLTPEVKRRITLESLKNVVCEGIAIYCVTLSLAFWLFNYGKYCDVGCVAKEPSPCTATCLNTFEGCLDGVELNGTC